ncbi:MAG: molybdopterin converting factor subunit 1 [Phycisphaeraceae bacterium]
MKIKVLYFGVLAHNMGRDSEEISLPDNARVEDAIQTLSHEYEVLGRYRSLLAYAVNLEYVSSSQTLKDGDELAMIPPVSGG